jgi:alpha-ribazole phosphatase
MSDILFIRHAETNMAGTFCGHSDPELNALGRLQLAGLIDKLRPEHLSAVYTSDLRRAQMTGSAIAKAFNVNCHVRPHLREIGFGQWEGLAWKEIQQRDEINSRRWVAEYPLLSAPGGESFRNFEQRVLDEVKFLHSEAKGRCIAVVTHAGVIRTVLCALRGCSEEDAWKQTRSYCSIIRHTGIASPSMRKIEVQL